MITAAAPRATGKPLQEVDLKGKLFPWDGAAPVFLQVPHSPDLYLPCFSTAPALRAAMTRAKAPFASIKRIEDQWEFLESLPREVKVALDPYWLPNGRVRWTEVKWH